MARQPDDRKRETSWFKKQAATLQQGGAFLYKISKIWYIRNHLRLHQFSSNIFDYVALIPILHTQGVEYFSLIYYLK